MKGMIVVEREVVALKILQHNGERIPNIGETPCN